LIASVSAPTLRAGFLHTSLAPLVRGGRRIFYLGDHDLSCGHIEENTRRVLAGYGLLRWEKIAITGVQVCEHGYEADAVTKKDHRYKPPQVFRAVETERLGQVPLMHLLRERLDAALVSLIWLDIAFLLGFPIAFVLYYVLMRFWVLPRYKQAEIEQATTTVT